MKLFSFAMLIILSVATAFAVAPTTAVAPRTDNNVIVASFNIMHFSEDRQNVAQVAKVIQNFDLCGIVELETVAVMEKLEKELEFQTGIDWKFIASPETGRGKKIERFAYIWRTDRVENYGKAYNLPDPRDKYCNEPYVAYFKAGNFDFAALLVHVLWFPPHKKAAEVKQLAVDYKSLFGKEDEKDIILMGDFNYNHDHPKMGVITGIRGIVKLEPQGVQTRVSKKGTMEEEYIDHIYTFDTTSEWTGKSGAFYFVPVLYQTEEDRRKAYTLISDHLPVWAEFATDRQDDD